MSVEDQIAAYIDGQPEPKRGDMRALHEAILRLTPGGRLWFLDGKNDEGRTVANPNIGYGARTMTYAGGKTREFYQVGLSANTGGISIYVLGLADKAQLSRDYGGRLGKATVTGYCIRFRALKDIDLAVLEEAI
eukprot:gene25597-25749_t